MEMKGLPFMLKTVRRSSCADAPMRKYSKAAAKEAVRLPVKGCMKTISLLLCFLLLQSSASFAAEAAADNPEFKKNPDSLYKDVFDNNVYYDNTSYLHLDRLGRKIFGKKLRSADVNLYDEVADSAFFTNRHARKALSAQELAAGNYVSSGPELSGKMMITDGYLMGLRPVFTVKDSKGEEYTLYFDSPDSIGMMTAAMIIASRFYHAIGYNVPQITLVSLSPENLIPQEGARFVDSSGFKRKLTQEKLDTLTLMIPWADDGKFRAAAVKTPVGIDKGTFSFQGRRKNDPNDKWNHQEQRELRALRVFGSWLNDFNFHDQSTRDYLVNENGQTFLKHYLTGFYGALGSDTEGAKPPMIGYEYLYDAGETTKAFWTLGFWEKPWQRRWRESGETVHSTAVGYFDNNEFNPKKFKTFLPQYVFKDLTRADAFWAAKIIKSFSDEDIRAIVKAGKYTEEPDETFIADQLIKRRDLAAAYWFSKSAPLDDFDFKGGQLTFTDLEAKYGFDKGASYQLDIREGKKTVASKTFEGSSVSIDGASASKELWIRKVRSGVKNNPWVKVKLNSGAIAEVVHQD